MLGIIGGTGLYRIEGLSQVESLDMTTPFGKPSAPITVGVLGGVKIAFLPRHGSQHEYLPSEINYRANIWGLKKAGVRSLLSVSAVGSLKEEIAPGEFVVVGQYVDWTRGKRAGSFFGEGVVAHISTANPTCSRWSSEVVGVARSREIRVSDGRTYVCVEGPRLGSRAESFLFRKLDCDVVGMTNVPEAFLAREAQMCFASIGVVTDYDCWRDNADEHASADAVIARYHKSMGTILMWLGAITEKYATQDCSCRKALQGALVTPKERTPPAKAQLLEVLLS